ncbi:hypothetical protein BC749_104287 [Flavobacterium araucananum]|uniref:O-antigen polymerase n=1 Tax=Flavobacterium araucananum TaxID=946678 RepID=A0A227PGB9_9FLAO|nr:hypothetical protein [Flavobacterium araucananum]OXG08338.1 hypothetical protein B0A64_06140 [Flavobacterium araucananum]PWJ99131.1 hypothetical protein BC749_104287 [Flavobacterium araucananum]
MIEIVFHYTGAESVKLLLYGCEILFILFSLNFVIQETKKGMANMTYLIIYVLSVSCTFFLNEHNKIDDAFKIFGGIAIYSASLYSFKNGFVISKKNQIEVGIISLLPLLIFVFDKIIGFQESVYSISIFPNSNNYVLYNICCVWLMMIYNFQKKYILTFLIISFLITTTLGALLSVLIAVCYYFRSKIFRLKYIFSSSFLLIVIVFLITYSDIYIFEKLRNSITVFGSLLNEGSVGNLSSVSFEDALLMSNSKDDSNLSFLFRIKIWTEIIYYFFNQDFFNLIFGLGFRSVPQINSFGLVAHNDYLTWLVDLGFSGFCIIVYGVWSGFKKLSKTEYIIPYLSILIYFFTENLFYNFFAVIIFCFCLATSIRILNK